MSGSRVLVADDNLLSLLFFADALAARGLDYATALATTADDAQATRAALLAAGFVGVVLKPISVDALRATPGHFVPTGGHPDPADWVIEALDDQRALAAAGGDAAIVHALRGLLVSELDALPAELAAIAAHRSAPALRDRLHRLDASARFCGVPALLGAATTPRTALDAPTGSGDKRFPRALLAYLQDVAGTMRVRHACHAAPHALTTPTP